MSQLGDAITRYHKILESDHMKDLSWVSALQARMEAERLWSGGRLLCPFLRPHFLTHRQYDSLVRTAESLISAIDRAEKLILQDPALMANMELLPAEKMLATIDPGYNGLAVAAQLDSHVNNGSLHLVQYNADSPSGLAWAEGLSDIFYDSPPVKEFRKRYHLTKIGGKKYLLSALLKAYKQFGGRHKPNIAVLELKTGSHASAHSEYEIFCEFFRREGYSTELVSPDQMEYKNGVLRKGKFDIHLVYRRISVQEFLMRFDLRHPLVAAYRDHAVCVVNSFRSELSHKNSIFDPLTDEDITAQFPAAERKAIREHVPWTRLVAATKTKYQGEPVDLLEFVMQNREKLALKPNDDYTGRGSFFGWEMDQAGWERALREAMRSPYVVQEKVDPVRTVFPLVSYGHLEFREMRVDVHPQAYLGRVLGCSSWLSPSHPGGFSSASGLVPTFVLEAKS